MKRTDEFRCPYCGTKNIIEVDTIFEEDGNTKDLILSDDFCVHYCDECHKKFDIQYPFAYINEMDHEIIMLNGESDISITDEFQFNNLEAFQTWTKRIVTTVKDAKEKIVLFDAGIDDRVIEVLKLGFISSLKKRAKENEIEIKSVHVEPHDDKLVFYAIVRSNDEPTKKCKSIVEIDKYYSIRNDMLPMLEKSERTSVVDLNWAIEFTNEN